LEQRRLTGLDSTHCLSRELATLKDPEGRRPSGRRRDKEEDGAQRPKDFFRSFSRSFFQDPQTFFKDSSRSNGMDTRRPPARQDRQALAKEWKNAPAFITWTEPEERSLSYQGSDMEEDGT
jgi:hypothetical protein